MHFKLFQLVHPVTREAAIFQNSSWIFVLSWKVQIKIYFCHMTDLLLLCPSPLPRMIAPSIMHLQIYCCGDPRGVGATTPPQKNSDPKRGSKKLPPKRVNFFCPPSAGPKGPGGTPSPGPGWIGVC